MTDTTDILAAATGTSTDHLLVPAKEEPPKAAPEEPPPKPPRKLPKLLLNKTVLLSILLFLLLTLPLGVHFISQRNQLNELRKQAAEIPGPYPGSSSLNISSGSCTEDATECNDTGGMNYCSGGKWYSRPKNPGETCPSSSGASATGGCVEGATECNNTGGVNYCSGGSWYSRAATSEDNCGSMVRVISQNFIDTQFYPSCIFNFIAQNHKPSDAKRYCDQLKSQAQQVAVELPNIPLPKINTSNPVVAGIAVGEYVACVTMGMRDRGETRTEAHNDCKRLLENPVLPKIPDIDVKIPPTVIPGVREIGQAEYYVCLGIAMSPQYDFNIEEASKRCDRLLTNPELPRGPDIQIPDILKNVQYGGCVVGKIIQDGNKTSEQAQKECGGTIQTATSVAIDACRLCLLNAPESECGPVCFSSGVVKPPNIPPLPECSSGTNAQHYEWRNGGCALVEGCGLSQCDPHSTSDSNSTSTQNLPPQMCKLDGDCRSGQKCSSRFKECYQPVESYVSCKERCEVSYNQSGYDQQECIKKCPGSEGLPPQMCKLDGDCPSGQKCSKTFKECYTPTIAGLPIPTPPPGPGGPGPVGPGPGTSPTGAPPPPQCTRLRVYKGGQVVTDYATLQAGDQLQLAVAAGSASKGRVRVNGGSWNETTTKNGAGEYVVSFTVPAGTTNFSIEGAVFANGQWM